MNGVSRVVLAMAVLFAAIGHGMAQDKEPPDYSKKTVAEWIAVLKGPYDPESLGDAEEALGPDGPYANKAVRALIEALNDAKPYARFRVAETLCSHGPIVVPRLIGALKRPEAHLRAGAAEAIRGIFPKARDAVPSLLELMNDKAPVVRAEAAKSLGSMGRRSDKTVPALAIALKDQDPAVRVAAVESLHWFGSKAEPAVPMLIVALSDKDFEVRYGAAGALAEIGPAAKAAVPALMDAFQRENSSFHSWKFMSALAEIGPPAKSAVPVLIDAIQKSDMSTHREALISVLARFGPMAKPAIPLLVKKLGESDEPAEVRVAIRALGCIGPDAKAAVPALLKVAKDKSHEARFDAMLSLGKVGPDAKVALPTMIDALGSDRRFHYGVKLAIEGLAAMGPDAKDAIPALIVLARDLSFDEWIRRAAANAVIKIEPNLAAKERMEFAHLNVRLDKVPDVKLRSPIPLTEAKKKQIRALIGKLAEIKDIGAEVPSSATGYGFAPQPGPDVGNSTSATFRSLVEMGPDALPFLLDALEDQTPTKMKVSGIGIGCGIEGNPLNPIERRVLSNEQESDEDEADWSFNAPYTLKVGDVCFVAIGQIVGRPYSAVYSFAFTVSVNSPAARKGMRDRLRAIWSSDNPSRRLLDSLLIDYATQGLFNGRSLDGWGEGSDRQVRAVKRLLCYFPTETAPLIATRLRAMDVKDADGDAHMMRDVKNGVDTIEFIKAVSWSKDPAIQDALAGIAKRTDDKRITQALSK